MKKLICLLLCMILVASFAACGSVEEVLSDDDTAVTTKGDADDTENEDDEYFEEDEEETDVTDEAGQTKKTKKTRKTTTKKTTVTTTTRVITTAAPRTTTKKTTVKTTEDPAVYPTHTNTVAELTAAGKWLAHGRAALVGEEFQMDWVNTGFEVSGKLGGTLSVETVSTRPDSLLNVVIDDNDPIVVHVAQGTSTTTLVSGLSKGPHTVKVISGTSLRFGTLSVKSFTYDGELSTVSRPSNRMRIEVIGDSISCGWGLDGVSGGSYTTKQQVAISNSYYSYAAVAARYLNADLQVVAKCACTIPTVHSYFPKRNLRGGTWDTGANPQDVVIINLGTNDEWQALGLNREEYNAINSLANMKALLTDVRKAYPDAYVIWVYGMMRKSYESEYNTAISSMNDAKMFALDMSAYKSSGGYDGNHPKRNSHAAVGAALADFIEQNCK